MIRSIALSGLSIAIVASATLAKPEPLPVDPVLLVEHDTHAPGVARFAAEHEGRIYHFATDESRARFVADPARYAVRLGGSCARMGPFSGEGRVDLYAAVEGRVYLFASESCRETFLTHHPRLLETDDAPIDPTPEARARADAVLKGAIDRATGGRGLGAFAWFETTRTERVESGGTEYEHEVRTRYGLDGRSMEHINRWNERTWTRDWTGEGGTFSDPEGGERSMAADQSEACRRAVLRQPLVMLAAYERGEATAEWLGREKDTDRVRLHARGVTLELLIGEDHEIVASIAQDRGASMMMGRLTRLYTSEADSEGLRVPTGFEVTFDGDRETSMDRSGLIATAGPLPGG